MQVNTQNIQRPALFSDFFGEELIWNNEYLTYIITTIKNNVTLTYNHIENTLKNVYSRSIDNPLMKYCSLFKSYETSEFVFIESFLFIKNASDYSSLYLEFKEHELKPSTYYKYQNIVSARISPYFKDIEIKTIKPSDIKKWLYNINDVGAKSKKHYIGVLSGIFQEALYDDVISKNPVKQIRMPKYEKPTITPFTADEVYTILNHAKNYNFKHYLAIAFYIGMRSGEIIALKKTDIDFKRRLINVSRSRGIFGESTPKTKYSIRQIPIIDTLLPYIEDIYNHHDYEYLFINQYKKPYRDNNVFTYKFW